MVYQGNPLLEYWNRAEFEHKMRTGFVSRIKHSGSVRPEGECIDLVLKMQLGGNAEYARRMLQGIINTTTVQTKGHEQLETNYLFEVYLNSGIKKYSDGLIRYRLRDVTGFSV